MPQMRKCAKCGEPTLEPVERKMEIYNSVYSYKCTNCQHEVELVPPGSLGVQTTIGLLFAVAIWFLFMDDHGSWPGPVQIVVLAGVVSVLPLMTIFQLRKHRQYPLVERDAKPKHLDVEETANITKKPVMWIESLGFLGGVLAPILLIIVVLVVAALIGYINFTFFDDKLFG